MKQNTKYRATSVHQALNREKVRSIKALRNALKGEMGVSKNQIDAAKAILELLTYYEPSVISDKAPDDED